MDMQLESNIDFIIEVFRKSGRKITNRTCIKRLDNAIKALEKENPSAGAIYRGAYYFYTNRFDAGFNFLEQKMEQFPDSFGLKLSFVTHSFSYHRNIEKAKDLLDDCLSSNDLSEGEIKQLLIVYAGYSSAYFEYDEKYQDLLEKYSLEDYFDFQEFEENLNILQKFNITRENHKQFFKIINHNLSRNYLKSFFCCVLREAEAGYLQLIISNTSWNIDQAMEMKRILDAAILAVDDVDFQIAADKIEIICIHTDPDELPEDFTFYDDDDFDLQEKILQRLTEEKTAEVFDEQEKNIAKQVSISDKAD